MGESEWFGVWDVDEFVVLNASYSDMHEFVSMLRNRFWFVYVYFTFISTIRKINFVIAKFDNYLIPITTFGYSGYITTPTGLVIENYLWRSNFTVFG